MSSMFHIARLLKGHVVIGITRQWKTDLSRNKSRQRSLNEWAYAGQDDWPQALRYLTNSAHKHTL
jgi:hypothetical protein